MGKPHSTESEKLATERHENAQRARVDIRTEVVTLYEDSLEVTPGGHYSIGSQIDRIIGRHAEEGQRMGKITIDLSDFSDTFIPPAIHAPETSRSGSG